ncbi:MAG TPA: hypothetical protein VMU19_07555 [Bryobacteraceae bacterium]|nr:hypothetical protein [Bryobacteraceae bacterium]
MRQASIRDLRYNFPAIEKALSEGQEIEITKRKRVVARLIPATQPARPVPERPPAPAHFPDYRARLKDIFGDKVLKVTAAQLIREERDGRP